MKRLSFAILAGLALSGCSTVQSSRNDTPTFEGSTVHTLGQFQSCFIDQFAGDTLQPAYTPRENGGSYVERIGLWQNYVAFVVDITDTGKERHVVLHAKGSIWGPNKKLIRRVQSCL